MSYEIVHEKRLSARLLRYWENLKKEAKMPFYQKLNPGALDDVWPQCFVVSVDRRKGLSYTYLYMGEPVSEIYGKDLTGMTVDSRMTRFPGAVVFKNLVKVVEEEIPAFDEGHMINEKSQLIKFRSCFLPFGTEQKGLTHILVGLSFRIFR